MNEDNESKRELEKPTDTDIRLLFCDMKTPMEALQRIFVSAIEKLQKEGIDVGKPRLQVEENELTLWLGDYIFWHRVSESVWKPGS